MAITTRNVTFVSLSISVLLLLYVCFILVSNYKSQMALQQTILKQFSVENERLANTLSSFFNNRKEDLINLAASRQIDVFFENKALGMSMEYGLKQSIPPIKQRFYALLNRYKTEKKSLYLRIALLDEHGNILSEAYPTDSRPQILSEAKDFLSPEQDKPTFIPKNKGKEIIVSLAYYFKGKYSGQIVAWLQPEYLKVESKVDSSSSHRTSFLIGDDLKMPLSGKVHGLPEVEIMRLGEVHTFQITDKRNKKQEVIGVKTPVLNTPFAVATVAPVDDLFEGLEPKGLLIGMGVLAIVIIGGTIFSYRISINSLVLGARLDEAHLHKTEMLEKNKQLEAEIAERKRAEEELRQLSIIDELTGLNNRRGFLILAKQHIKIADRLKKGVVLIYADMDDMKWINDTFGHKEGDQALIDIVNILKSTLRASDIVARWGGDEFVGLVLESTERAGEVVRGHLQEKINAHNLEGVRPFQLSISFGMTRYNPENPCTLEELLERGDRLMYEHKQSKKRRYTSPNESL